MRDRRSCGIKGDTPGAAGAFKRALELDATLAEARENLAKLPK
jgi:hypothetical protein